MIKITKEYTDKVRTCTLKELLERHVNRDDGGTIESLQYQIERQTELLAYLFEKISASDSELTELCGEWGETVTQIK